MTYVNVTKSNREFDELYKGMVDNNMFKNTYEKHVIINNDSFFSRFMFMKAVESIYKMVDQKDFIGMKIYECFISDEMSLYTFNEKNDYIYESYNVIARTSIGNFSQKMIPQHSMNNPIKNDKFFIEEMYEKMSLDLDFQNISINNNGVKDYPIRHVQVDILLAMYKHLGKHNRADFLYICREFYDMVKDLNDYSNVRIKKISSRHKLDILSYNPILTLNLCDNVDRVICNEESGNRYMIGYSTNFKEKKPTNILRQMKHI